MMRGNINMRVLQINAVNRIKSTGRICVEMADYLNKNGNEGYIAFSDGPSYEKGYKIGTYVETKLHGLYSRIFGLQGYFSMTGTRKLLDYIEVVKPDVVHLHNLHGNYINLRLLLEHLAQNDIATVITLHDCWFYTGKCTHYTVYKCYKWKDGCGNCSRLRKDNPSWLFDRTVKMYNDKKEWFEKIPRLAVVGVSQWITNEARESILLSAKIVTRIYNWIDLDVFKPASKGMLRNKLNLENKFIILGVASGWSNAKGLYKFIELAELISEDMVILLVGNIDKKVSLPQNVIHIKETHKIDELVEYYSMADVFVNLSLEESFGKVTAEALACGTPVVVINSTANPELVGDRCGYIVNDDSMDKILKYILYIKKLGKKYYSEHCIKYAQNNFNIEDRLHDYVELYKKIIAS